MLKIEKTAEQNEILQLSKELSNDVCLDVRRASSSQMDKIIKSLNQNQIPGYGFSLSFSGKLKYIRSLFIFSQK